MVATPNAMAVGEPGPARKPRFVPKPAAVASLAGAPPLDARRFREDVDGAVDQDPAPRA